MITLDEHRAEGTRANDEGQSLRAFDIAQSGLDRWPGDRTLTQIEALALARMGSYARAKELLAGLPQIEDDDETIGLQARVFKDIWLKAGDVADLRTARDLYRKAYSIHAAIWPGINAATLTWILGEAAAAVALASKVAEAASLQTGYWAAATVAEAALIIAATRRPEGGGSEWADAERKYRAARPLAAGNLGHILSTWRNAGIVLRQLTGKLVELIERALNVPRVAVFAGHRVDSQGRLAPRFPAACAPAVKAAIREELLRLNIGVGFAAAASGSDILFLEALKELGGKTHIVLPCNQEQFVEVSVLESGPEWVDRFNAVVRDADELVVASEQRLDMGGIAFRYSGDVLDGLAVMRAAQYETALRHIAVWNGLPGDGEGGTCDNVQRWLARGHTVRVIDPRDAKDVREVSDPASFSQPSYPETFDSASGVTGVVGAMIFADVKHFSRLNEKQIPGFLRDFVGPVANLARLPPKPLFQNTWGDGLFFVFERVTDAARFALALRDRAAAINRHEAELPDELSLRIGLHAGPVYRFQDQIVEKQNYVGSHVNRAARIEPVTPPGRVYATESFAALATLESPGMFRFDYVGKLPLAKDFGVFSLYDLNQ